MVKDAEDNAALDKERVEKITIKNNADTLCYQTKAQLETLESTISADEKTRIEGLVTELELAIKNENYDEIATLTTTLTQSLSEISSSAPPEVEVQ